MIYIPKGYFQMGSSSGKEDEKPMHFVFTPGYFIDKYEVSNKNYAAFMLATEHQAPKFWNDSRFNEPDQPVVGVSWHDAMAYAKWKKRRLPTEAEWEKAARGNDGRLWPWGRKFDKGFNFFFVNIFGENDNYAYTAPVNYYHSGVSPFGLYNTAGNVWEWVDNKKSSRSQPNSRVVKGGGWTSDKRQARISYRNHVDLKMKNPTFGFRCAKSLKQKDKIRDQNKRSQRRTR